MSLKRSINSSSVKSCHYPANAAADVHNARTFQLFTSVTKVLACDESTVQPSHQGNAEDNGAFWF